MVHADFAAWSLYTGPSKVKSIIDNRNCSWIVGQWDGINSDTGKAEVRKDIDCRIDVIISAFKEMHSKFKTNNRHFVIPEFFFHCVEGPYPYIKVDDENYPFEYSVLRLKEELSNCIPNDDNYYTIIAGTTLTSNVKNYELFLNSDEVLERQEELNSILPDDIYATFNAHNYKKWKRSLSNKRGLHPLLDRLDEFMQIARRNPLCTVRNRGAYFYFNKTRMSEMEVFVFEKQSESSVDLTMGTFDSQGRITTQGMITEWLANYPSYSIIKGDKQTTPSATYARFSHSPYGQNDIGVEICVDHYHQRLRRTVDMLKANGADVDNSPLVKQFIISGGEQILDRSVAADCNSIIFNADGADSIYEDKDNPDTVILKGNSGRFQGITCGVYNQSIQSKWIARDNNEYYSHSQIAFTTADSRIEGFNNALGISNTKALTYGGLVGSPYNSMTDSISRIIIPFNIAEDIFAINKSELHHYAPK